MKLAVLSPAAQRRLSGVPPRFRAKYVAALAGKASPREAIKIMCLECVGYVSADVAGCTSDACPLHKYRPFRSK